MADDIPPLTLVDPVNLRDWVDDRWGAPQCGLPPTQRQLDVFLAIIERGGEAQAADALGISIQTIKNHMTDLYARLRVHNQLAALWVLYPTLRGMDYDGIDRRSGYDRRQGLERRR